MTRQHRVHTVPVTSLWADPGLAAQVADERFDKGWTLVAAYVVESKLHMLFARDDASEVPPHPRASSLRGLPGVV